jgi:hypothetical protein
MMRLRRIGVFSAGRFGFWLGLALTLAEIIVALFMLAMNGIPPTALPPEIWGQIAWFIFVTALIMAFSVFVFALIYNWSTDIFGGLELEFEMARPSEEMLHNSDGTTENED